MHAHHVGAAAGSGDVAGEVEGGDMGWWEFCQQGDRDQLQILLTFWDQWGGQRPKFIVITRAPSRCGQDAVELIKGILVLM